MTYVKICGNTNIDDVKKAVELNADYLGFIFVKSSKRFIQPEDAAAIIKSIPQFENFVGVFSNQPKDHVEKIAKDLQLKYLQFHGEETSRYCDYFTQAGFKVIKTFHIKDSMSLKRIDEYDVDAFLFDTYSSSSKGGTGLTFDWGLIEDKPYVQEKLFLAGGLSQENLKDALTQVTPYAVDVASGVEMSPGKKDFDKLKSFIELAHNYPDSNAEKKDPLHQKA